VPVGVALSGRGSLRRTSLLAIARTPAIFLIVQTLVLLVPSDEPVRKHFKLSRFFVAATVCVTINQTIGGLLSYIIGA